MLFAAALLAQRPQPETPKTRQVAVLAWAIQAENRKEAELYVNTQILSLWPPTNGWEEHHAFLTEVPEDFIRAEMVKIT